MYKTFKDLYPSEYVSWHAAKKRCHYSPDSSYGQYGGKGIKMSLEWQTDFAQFVFDMGPKPTSKHTLDRIDNNKGYECGNCKWSTRQEQNWNKKTTIQKTLHGVTKPLAQWCFEYDKPYDKVMLRLKYGWDLQEALTRP